MSASRLMCTLTLVSIIPETPLTIITFCYVHAPLTLSHVHESAREIFAEGEGVDVVVSEDELVHLPLP